MSSEPIARRSEDVAAGQVPSRETRSGEGAYVRFVARRFLRGRSRRPFALISVLVASGFTLGVASLIVALSLMSGFHGTVWERIIGANAHIFIYPADGSAKIPQPDNLVEQVNAVEGVAAAEAVVRGFGVATASAEVSRWTVMVGFDPEQTVRVTDLAEHMIEGSLADLELETPSGRPPVVLGGRLARQLGVIPGERVQFTIPRAKLTPWGVTVKRATLEVVGLFETGMAEYDESWSLVSLETGWKLFGSEGSADWIAVRLDDPDQIETVRERLIGSLEGSYFVEDILGRNRTYHSALRLEKLMTGLAVGLIIVVAAIGVISTLVLTVTDKVREIGVLLAMGASPRGILRIFQLQGMAMAIAGIAVGVIFGVGLCWTFDAFKLISLDPDVYLLDHLPFKVQPLEVLWIVLVSLAVGWAATIVPAWRAARMDPIKALRRD